MTIHSVHDNGTSGVIVSVESSMSNGLPNILLVGYAGKSLDESRERIRSAFSTSSLSLPRKRITINVSPSDIPKDGAHFDVSIALSILASARMIKMPTHPFVALGELGLDGTIRPVRGVIGKILVALQQGYTDFIIPKQNVEQASLIEGIRLYGVETLRELSDTLQREPNECFITPVILHHKPYSTSSLLPDFNEIIGQKRAKRALEIAAAGKHNVLLNGPPGVGKSMLAKAMPALLPPPSRQDILEITQLHSLTNDNISQLITERPFRSPHHSASDVSIIGGGQRPKPGEVSLAHNGVLFLDELPEFKRSTIEALRQPLEDHIVTVSRARETASYPADFMLIATQNPCPCGFYGSSKPCTCTAIELHRYQKKLSGPILDRIDIHVTVDNVEHNRLLSDTTSDESSDTVNKRVAQAYARQIKRQHKTNAQLANREIKAYFHISPAAKSLLDSAAESLGLSARVYMKTLKVAQTIADLEVSDTIETHHIAEAIQYRPAQTAEYAAAVA